MLTGWEYPILAHTAHTHHGERGDQDTGARRSNGPATYIAGGQKPMSRDTSYFVVTSRTLQVQILDKMVFDTGRRGRARVKVNQKSKE